MPVYAQDTFTDRPVSSQDAYIQVSVTMAALIAGQIETEMGACIDEWYSAANGVREDRNREIRGRIAEFPGYHASAVILASVQQACGDFAE